MEEFHLHSLNEHGPNPVELTPRIKGNNSYLSWSDLQSNLIAPSTHLAQGSRVNNYVTVDANFPLTRIITSSAYKNIHPSREHTPLMSLFRIRFQRSVTSPPPGGHTLVVFIVLLIPSSEGSLSIPSTFQISSHRSGAVLSSRVFDDTSAGVVEGSFNVQKRRQDNRFVT